MSNINDYLDYISTANYGSDVREAIVSSIRECYKDATGHPDSVAALVQEYIDREEKIDGAVTALTGLYNSLGDIVYSYDYNNGVSGIHIAEDEFGCVDQITLGPGKWIIKVVSWFAIISNASPDIGIMYLSFSNTLDSDGFPIPLNDTYNYKDDSYSGTILNSSGSHTHFVKMIELTEERTIYMWIKHTGRLSSDIVVSPHMTAMKIGESTPSDGTSLVDQVVENTEDIVVLEGKVATNISDISTLTSDVDALEEDVSDIKSDLEELQEEIEGGGSGLTDGAKQALLACIAHIGVWSDEHGQDYYDALESALYPPANLTSISCVYTQSGTVYNTDSLDDLESDLVVTAHYDNDTTSTVTTYVLSGTLTVGTSTITVSYGGFTTTFTVTVTEYVIPPLYSWDFTQSLTDSVGGLVATLYNTASQDSDGVKLTAANDYVTLGDIFAKNRTYEIDIADSGTLTYSTNGRLFTHYASYPSGKYTSGVVYRGANSTYALYENEAWAMPTTPYGIDSIKGKTVKFVVKSSSTDLYIGGVLVVSDGLKTPYSNTMALGAHQNALKGVIITALRVYEGEV